MASSPGPLFPSTRWSRILAAPTERDWEALARAYWRPIHAWLAARFRLRAPEADDLTQEAFAWMLATRLLDRADPARGSFRAFLKTALTRFALEQRRKATAAKRGGGITLEPLAPDGPLVDDHGRTPDQELDAAWRRELLQRATTLLEAELDANGRGEHWQLFRDWFLADLSPASSGAPVDLDYAELARRHGITKVDVSNRLAYAKRRYRELLRGLVEETVRDAAELDEELAWLFGAPTP